MKLLLVPALAAALLGVASPPVRATPLDDRIAELKHAVEKEASARTNGPANPNGFINPAMSPAFIDAAIDQVVSQIENPAYGNNMDAQLAQITSMYTSTEVQEATTNLLNEIKSERKEKTDAEIASVKALLARAGPAVLQAKKPEDLDDLIDEMSKHGNNSNGGNPALQGDQELTRQFFSSIEFVKKWQDYLAHLTTGQTDLARNDLQMLSNNNWGEGLLPRSKLIELESPDRIPVQAGKPATAISTPAMEAQAILDGMKTLDDIKPTLARLEPLRQGDFNVQNVSNQLSQMEANYEDLKASLPVQSGVNFNYNTGGINVPPAIRSQYLLFTLQARFDSYKGPPPAPGEKPSDYVDRVIADATTREDWELLRRADAARGSLEQNNGVGYNPMFAGGIDNIIAGSHQQDAGQFALAVRSYEQALQSDDPAIPAKIIGDKLTAIQRDHPKEYADGMQLTVSPPSPRYYTGPVQQFVGPGQQVYPRPYLPPGLTNTIQSAPIPASLLSGAATTNAAPAPVAPPAK